MNLDLKLSKPGFWMAVLLVLMLVGIQLVLAIPFGIADVVLEQVFHRTSPHLEQQPDGFILGSGDISKSDVYDLSFQAPLAGVTALRIEVASHPSLPNDGPGLTNYEGPLGGFFLSELQAFQAGRICAHGTARSSASGPAR